MGLFCLRATRDHLRPALVLAVATTVTTTVVALRAPPFGGGGNNGNNNGRRPRGPNGNSNGGEDAAGSNGFPRAPFFLLVPLTVGGVPLAASQRKTLQTRADEAENAYFLNDAFGADFSGRWRLERSVNFDEYLTSLNVSATHRRFAARAAVEHHITRECHDIPGTATFEICVVNRLGSKCERFVVGDGPLFSSDARGEPIIKRITWEDARKSVLVTIVESSVGRLTDRRFFKSRDEMVMELVSTSGVRAYRHFARVKDKDPGDDDDER